MDSVLDGLLFDVIFIKLENILIDNNLNLKTADFGFTCYKTIDNLKNLRGTFTYMNPEVREGRDFSGQSVDISCSEWCFYHSVRHLRL